MHIGAITLLSLGVLFLLLGAVGIVRFPDCYTRMHAAGKCDTLGALLVDGAEVTDTELVDALRGRLSSYKLPKHVVRVDRLFRSPNGKADYKWATRTARDALGITD